MKHLTAGELLLKERSGQDLYGEILIEGIGTRQTLSQLETDQLKPDKLMMDILLQRLGRSPDKQ